LGIKLFHINILYDYELVNTRHAQEAYSVLTLS